MSHEVTFATRSAMDHHMGDDFHLEGVDIEKIHVFGEGQVILFDAFQFRGGVVEQHQSEGQGRGKKDEEGDHA